MSRTVDARVGTRWSHVPRAMSKAVLVSFRAWGCIGVNAAGAWRLLTLLAQPLLVIEKRVLLPHSRLRVNVGACLATTRVFFVCGEARGSPAHVPRVSGENMASVLYIFQQSALVLWRRRRARSRQLRGRSCVPARRFRVRGRTQARRPAASPTRCSRSC